MAPFDSATASQTNTRDIPSIINNDTITLSTNSNGDINLTPDGTGEVKVGSNVEMTGGGTITADSGDLNLAATSGSVKINSEVVNPKVYFHAIADHGIAYNSGDFVDQWTSVVNSHPSSFSNSQDVWTCPRTGYYYISTTMTLETSTSTTSYSTITHSGVKVYRDSTRIAHIRDVDRIYPGSITAGRILPVTANVVTSITAGSVIKVVVFCDYWNSNLHTDNQSQTSVLTIQNVD